MIISSSAILPLFIVSFILLVLQYLRINPDRRLLNLQFGMMLGAIVLMFAQLLTSGTSLSLVLFLLALFWLGLTLYLFRTLPPPKS